MNRPLIVVVDDDENIRDAYSEALQDDGFDVHGYRNGKEALEALGASTPPCLILLDWMMPVMSGEEFIRQGKAKEIANTVPVLVVSATADTVGEIPGIKAKLPKPIDLDTLLAAVHRFVAPLPGTGADNSSSLPKAN